MYSPASLANKLPSNRSGSPISPETLDDLCSRFIINIPEPEKNNLIRICFQIEQAHWFYLDFYAKGPGQKKKSCALVEFTRLIFQHIPKLRPFVSEVDSLIQEWKEYKSNVPTYGSILLNEDMTKVLLVQSFYSKASWGFPKGKINKGESAWQCAIREVYEEIGFDTTEIINPCEFVEESVNDQIVRLYVIPGVKETQHFQPQTRNEIKAISWFPLADLPSSKKVAISRQKIFGPNSFFMVIPFVKKLRQWVYVKSKRNPRRPRHKSCGNMESAEKLSSDDEDTLGELSSSSLYRSRRTLEYVMTQDPGVHSPLLPQFADVDSRPSNSYEGSSSSSFVRVAGRSSNADFREQSSSLCQCQVPSPLCVAPVPFSPVDFSPVFQRVGAVAWNNFKFDQSMFRNVQVPIK